VTATTISVVIPAFNAASFLAQALESALAEMSALPPGEDFEILVVDDCSKDATPDIAAGYARRGVRCLGRSAQGGIGAARNTGVAAAQGEFLAFLDADDLWPAGRLALLMAALDSLGAPGMAFGHLRQFACPSMNPDMRRRLRVPAEPIAGYCAGAMLLRRCDFLSVGTFNETLKVAEFIDWFGRARDRGLASRLIDQVVLERRIHGANQTIRHRADYGDYALTLKRALDRRRPGIAS
jgi:glycosyltransferase involved in cell wall biosynthesis